MENVGSQLPYHIKVGVMGVEKVDAIQESDGQEKWNEIVNLGFGIVSKGYVHNKTLMGFVDI